MLEKISNALKSGIKKISNAIFVDKKLIDEIIKDIQRSLIEADVNVELVFKLSEKIRKIALDESIKGIEKKEHLKRDYQLVRTPHIAKADLWKTSGHFDFYFENMYTFSRNDEEYVVKPMNCPYHILIYKKQTRSYRDLPIKYAELGTVYRYERSGTLHGMLRVRGFTQDDAHIFCSEEQIPFYGPICTHGHSVLQDS